LLVCKTIVYFFCFGETISLSDIDWNNSAKLVSLWVKRIKWVELLGWANGYWTHQFNHFGCY